MMSPFRKPYHKIIAITVCFCFIYILQQHILIRDPYSGTVNNKLSQEHQEKVKLFYDNRKEWKTSNVGSILFKNGSIDIYRRNVKKNKQFVILIWKNYDWLKSRHIDSYDTTRNRNPLVDCSMKNCRISNDDGLLYKADAVVVHVQEGALPNSTYRTRDQRWVFLSDESPVHAFSRSIRKVNISEWANIFNWSMTYRTDADIPVPYGRTIPLSAPIEYTDLKQLIPGWEIKQRVVTASVLMSNCKVSSRMTFLKKLRTHIYIDVYGACSDNNKQICPGHFRANCEVIDKYIFYLVLENSNCAEYLSEKSFYNAYNKGAIPIIFGPPIEDCEKILPPNSFLHADKFTSLEELAKEMLAISRSDDRILKYHKWRFHFKVVNEHGYFGTHSYHYCRVCEALNYNDDAEKVYGAKDLIPYFDPNYTCRFT